jgi:transcriptional regulator with AAA-type ATPase domain
VPRSWASTISCFEAATELRSVQGRTDPSRALSSRLGQGGIVMDELGELLGESRAIEMVRDKLRRLLERQRAGQRLPPVLIQGDTGTGKGLVARLLHRHGPAAAAPS